MERYLDWCDEHENLILLGMTVGTLILGPILYCLAANGRLNWLMTPFAYLRQAMNWICGC